MAPPIREKTLKSWFDKMPGVFLQHIETHQTGGGVPDTLMQYAGFGVCQVILVEAKIIEGKRVRGNPKTLQRQMRWHRTYAKSGGVSWLVGSHRHQGGAYLKEPVDDIYIWRGGDMDLALKYGIRPIQRTPWTKFSAPFDWKKIRDFLFDSV